MVENGQMALPVLTTAVAIARLHEITDSLSHGISELPALDAPLDADSSDAIRDLVSEHIEHLYTALNDAAPVGWVDPRKQAAADIRNLSDVQAATASIARNLELYLRGRATH